MKKYIMGFFNNIGTKTYDDIENYIKNRDWQNKEDNTSWWSSSYWEYSSSIGQEWNIKKYDEYIINYYVNIWDLSKWVKININNMMPALFDAMVKNKSIRIQEVFTQPDKCKGTLNWDVQLSFIVDEKYIISTDHIIVKLKSRVPPSDENQYNKSQQKLRLKYSNRKGWR